MFSSRLNGADTRGIFLNDSLRFLTAAVLVLCVSACGHKGPNDPDPVPLPEIACSATVTVTIMGASAPVSFPAPTITGGQPPVSYACTPASGSAFPLGTTTVSCLATDSASRQSACQFSVVVNGVQFGVKKFLAVGDSTTEGENGLGPQPPTIITPKWDDTPNAYPVKLQAMFESTYPHQGITVSYPSEIGGMRSGTLLNNLLGYLTGFRPEAVLVLTGYNDLSVCNAGYTDNDACDNAINALRNNVRDIIRTAKAFSGVRYVFVSTLTPSRPGGSLTRDSERIRDANDHLKPVIASEGATLVDPYPLFLGHESEYVSPDGLHLLPPGYQVLAQTFFDKIVATVPKITPQYIR